MVAFSGATGAEIHTFKGDGVSDGFGKAVASAGDIDGDSIPDLLGGAPFDNLSDGLFGGSVRAYSGGDGTLLYFLNGAASQHGFGSSIAGLGDVDGDVRSDFAIANHTKQDSQGESDGGFRVYSGATGKPFASGSFEANSSFGIHVRVAAAGDYRFATSIELPTSATSQTLVATATHKQSGAWAAQATLEALAGTRLDATIIGPPGITPQVTIHAPIGDKVHDSLYSTTLVGSSLTIDKALLLATGKYSIRVTGGVKNDAFAITLTPATPPAGSQIEMD